MKTPVKMPKSVMLAGRKFRLGLSPKESFYGGTMGQYIPMEGRIALANEMPPEQLKSTCLHEIFHDLNNQSTADLSETHVNCLAALMFAVIRDNPALMAWIQDRE